MTKKQPAEVRMKSKCSASTGLRGSSPASALWQSPKGARWRLESRLSGDVGLISQRLVVVSVLEVRPACLLCQLHRGQIGLKGTGHDKQPPSTSGGNAEFRRC